MVRRLAPVDDPALLVGAATGDDAAVYRLDDGRALVVTADFITPVVDDARTWGRVAAANAVSDVYAMGGRPLLETILLNFIDQGFRQFYFSVNYKAEMIENYFGNGEQFGVEIRYLKEKKRLGTAGALSLLPEIPTEPFIVTNGDLLAKVDYAHMVDAHINADIVGTMGVSEYDLQIPYGVIHTKNGLVHKIDEKPVITSLISGGVNVLSPSALKFIPPNSFFDMPTLFERLIEQNIKVCTYKVHEYWLDIGQVPDYKKANEDIAKVFPLTKY